MSMEERTGLRDLTYSQWHRPTSIARYVGQQQAATLGMIDVDGCEYCRTCRQPLALIETALDRGQNIKPAWVTTALASRAGIPAYVVLYDKTDDDDIAFFRVKRLTPNPDREWRRMSAADYAQNLVKLRTDHTCAAELRSAA
jgi:hypothetical protein